MKRTVEFHGTLQVPGDKSVSHRALIFSTLAKGACSVSRLSPAEDCRSTAACLRALGLRLEEAEPDQWSITSPGLEALKQPQAMLDAGNSGTTIRLLSGLLAGSALTCSFDGDASLRKRPMSRVLKYLQQMGAQIKYLENDNYPPFSITGGTLHGKAFQLEIASAQVQTALILAGLQADGETSVRLPAAVRDHTEKMFEYIGVPFTRSADGLETTVRRLEKPVAPYNLTVPGDISSAAFFMVAAACSPFSNVMLTDVGMNRGRTLVIDVLREMGANIKVTDEREQAGEPVANVRVHGGTLRAVSIGGDRIAKGIDEIPILALAGAFSSGTFSVRDAAELRVKESDRLAAIAENLRGIGVDVKEHADGFDIAGQEQVRGGSEWKTFGDHRLAMTGLVANLLCAEDVAVDDKACVAVSYPNFEHDLSKLAK